MRAVPWYMHAAGPLIPYIDNETMMKYASLALLLSLMLSGGSAHAQLLDASGALDVNGSASADTDGASVSSDTNMHADAGADADTGTSTGSAGTDESGDVSGAMDLGSAIEFSIKRSDMDEDTDYAVTDASSVRSSASLESYAAATMHADERLESLEMNGSGMDMRYRKPARFLWIIPASLTARVSVDTDGDATVRYPWYSFLMATDESRADLEARIRAEITSIQDSMQVAADAEAAGTASTGLKGDPEIRRWARIIESVYAAVSGAVRADASAQAAS